MLTRDQRATFAQYTSSDREVALMTDPEFLNYTTFLANQPDVNINKRVTNTIAVVKGVRGVRNVKQFSSLITMVSMILLALAFVGLFAVALIYFVVYFRKDQVKRMMDLVIFGWALAFVCLIAVFYALFWKMSDLVKKIVALM